MHQFPILLIPHRHIPIRVFKVGNTCPRSESFKMSSSVRTLLLRRHSNAFHNIFFVESATDAPVEETPSFSPAQRVPNDILGFHAARAIMEVSKLERDLGIHRKEKLFAF